jgi:hypothetical protein
MNEFYKFLNNVLAMPGMFGVSKVEDLNFIALGYAEAAAQLKQDQSVADFLAALSRHVSTKYKFGRLVDWSRAIRFGSGSDQHSLELFKENFEECYKQWK